MRPRFGLEALVTADTVIVPGCSEDAGSAVGGGAARRGRPRHPHRVQLHRFRDQLGTTPLQWLLRTRIRRAQHLLENTDHPIDRIGTTTVASRWPRMPTGYSSVASSNKPLAT